MYPEQVRRETDQGIDWDHEKNANDVCIELINSLCYYNLKLYSQRCSSFCILSLRKQ